MQNTPNLNLKKPEGTDVVDIADLNGNADILDAEFHATTGHGHTGAAGDGPKIGASGLANGAATDVVIGNRTVVDTVAATAAADTPTNLWSKLAYMIKAITGKANWYTAPVASLETLSASKAPLASPALTGIPTAPTAAIVTNSQQIATTAFVKDNLSGALSVSSISSQYGFTSDTQSHAAGSWSSPLYMNFVRTNGVKVTDNYLQADSSGQIQHIRSTDGSRLLIESTTADLTYYVRSDGNDTNNGIANTVGAAFKTIQKAISMIPQVVNHVVTVNVAAGTYPETVSLDGFSGKGILFLNGDSVVSTSRQVVGIGIQNSTIYITVTGLSFNATTGAAMTITNSAYVVIDKINSTNANSQAGVWFQVGSKGLVANSIISNKTTAVVSADASVLCRDNTGVGNSTVYHSSDGGELTWSGTRPTGTYLESIVRGGRIIPVGGVINPWGDNTMAQRSHVRAFVPSSQSVSSGAWTKVVFGGVYADHRSEYNSSLARLTAKESGVYAVNVGVILDDMPSGSHCYILVRLSGVDCYTTKFGVATSTSFGLTLDKNFTLNAGEYLEFYVYQGTGVTKTIIADNNYTHFLATRIA
ncbi:hypothetical protein D3C73_587770 [compost metagenome]